MSNNIHGLTVKDENGKTKAHPLYWVWHEKRKFYFMEEPWYSNVLDFVTWAEEQGWVGTYTDDEGEVHLGDCIRRHDTNEAYSPKNCYVHVRGTALGVEK